jgi:alginate O-acetyltransferase complex protein AlgI
MLYFIFPYKYRAVFLLTASCIFYMSFIPSYILILFFIIIIDYVAGIMIEKSSSHKKQFLIASILSNILLLAFFKYFNFFNENLSSLLSFFTIQNPLPMLEIVLPIGLSFHTFQSMSYIIEIYRGTQRAEKNFIIYSLYVMFYPQLVAGPIERPQNLLHQFYKKHQFDYIRVTNGLKRMAIGFFKKLVIADRLALMVNSVYSNPCDFQGISLITATIFFAFQIYCDFSGYIDIAIGCANIMGFNLMENFNYPYSASSISEFWRRWHISLTKWFTDYIYFPLGGSRVSRLLHYRNILIVFLISGLWHGASWTFVIWGFLNGFFLIFGHATKQFRLSIAKKIWLTKVPKIYKFLQTTTTFALICFSWIFFRAESIKDAFYIIANLFSSIPTWLHYFFTHLTTASSNKLAPLMVGLTITDFIISLICILLLLATECIKKVNIIEHVNKLPFISRWAVYHVIIICILAFRACSDIKFIYFQF